MSGNYSFLENLGGEAWGGEDDAYIFEFMTDFELTNTDSSISTWDFKLHSYYIENEVSEGQERDLEWHGEIELTSSNYSNDSNNQMSMGLVFK